MARLTIRETGDGLGIHVPAARNWALILFLLVWLGGWAAGEWFALSQIFGGSFGPADWFLVVWVSIWTIGGMGAMTALVWQFIGRERLFVTAGAVVHESGFPLLRRRKVWAPGEATSFRRASTGVYTQSVTPARGIAYDAGGMTHSFGGGLDSVEIGEILAAIGRHLPDATGGGGTAADSDPEARSDVSR